MTDAPIRALLPAGLRDILPPDADHEAGVVGQLMAHFASQGYERVKPPLIEFEDTLLDGAGAATSGQTFRVMDPVSQRMMGLRADITPQVARLAATRLGGAPRPLRLSYSGQVLRVKGSQLRPERQFGQAGIELIGSATADADAEVVILAAESLHELGVPGVSVDLSLPTLVPALLTAFAVDDERLRAALDHKDVAVVAALGGAAASVLTALVGAAGPADRALTALDALDLPPQAAAERDRLATVVALIRAEAPDLVLTVDPVENRGFEYHAGVAFTLFTKGQGNEVGRGGRYLTSAGEPATGATLFMDTVLAAVPAAKPVRRCYVPMATPRAWSQALRTQGWVTVAGLETVADVVAEAKRLGCSHFLAAGSLVNVD
ncbi:MAG: ATP phosphoribosyltransferase regulatory subunit [Magnetospirillum sp.]|nr:ATP phosphoribosyltransferase regulatory subunit [Magnetospirillum sp.]